MNKLEQLSEARNSSTSGEWRDTNQAGITQVKTSTGRFVALDMYDEDDAPSIEELEANAKFIAMAHNMFPDMIDAIMALANLVECLGDRCDKACANEIAQADVILKKIKGESIATS